MDENKTKETFYGVGTRKEFNPSGDLIDESDLDQGFRKSYDSMYHVDDEFFVTHESLTRPVDFVVDEGGFRTEYSNWNIMYDNFPGRSIDGNLFPRIESDPSAASRFLARTNPSKPEVSLPVFIGEFRDLPHQILERGREKIALKSADPIGVKYGILPLAGDVLKLLRLQESIDRRTKMLKRLFRKTKSNSNPGMRVKKKVVKSRTKTLDFDYHPEHHGGSPLDIHIRVESTETQWMSTTWFPNSSIDLPESDSATRDLAKGILLGIYAEKPSTAYIADAWELAPWSWLGDWFSNTGEHLDAHLNQVVANAGFVWHMQHCHTKVTAYLVGQPHVRQVLSRETKRRQRSFPSFEMTMPLLSHSQASILSDLIFSRRTGLKKSVRVNPTGGGGPSGPQ